MPPEQSPSPHAQQPDPRSDLELVEAANHGDAQAMEQIYLRHRDWSLRLAWRFTRDHELAMDVVQEAFMYLFKKIGSGGDAGGGLILTARLTTLLYPAIKNTALAARRKRHPLAMAMSRKDSGEPEIAAMPAFSLENDERTRELASLLGQLSDAHREVLLMKVVDGMEYTEIAAALSIPEGTVKSRLHHALATLRREATRNVETSSLAREGL